MSSGTSGDGHLGTTATARLEMFSDGVFAIAITLLVLELHVPEWKGSGSLLATLLHDWTQFLALVIGFMTILICWINHHFMFTMIHKSNSRMILVNGFKLLVVTTTPFATALLSKNMGTAWQGPAVSIYCFNFMLMGIAMSAIWFFAVGSGFVDGPPEKLKATSRLYRLPGVFSTLIFLISFASIPACLILSAVMFGMFVIPEWTTRRLMTKHKKEERLVPAEG